MTFTKNESMKQSDEPLTVPHMVGECEACEGLVGAVLYEL
jgi:hypothetical protein